MEKREISQPKDWMRQRIFILFGIQNTTKLVHMQPLEPISISQPYYPRPDVRYGKTAFLAVAVAYFVAFGWRQSRGASLVKNYVTLHSNVAIDVNKDHLLQNITFSTHKYS